MIIRICTEDKNSERIRELTAKRFDAFTIYRGVGAWKGKLEPSLTIDIGLLGTEDCDATKNRALNLARDIRDTNNQEAVLVEFIESTNVLI